MSGTPFKKLPASPSVSSPSIPVADRGGEEVNVGFSDFGAGSGNQLRDPNLPLSKSSLRCGCCTIFWSYGKSHHRIRHIPFAVQSTSSKKAKRPSGAAKTLLDSIPKDSVSGLRDLALIAAMFYRVSAVLKELVSYCAS